MSILAVLCILNMLFNGISWIVYLCEGNWNSFAFSALMGWTVALIGELNNII